MLGFETIGNATVIVHDGGPVLATDPWLGEAAYFGSWGLPVEVPEDQRQAILKAEFIFFSHGHPDHLNPESLEHLHGKKILLPDHVGGRIRDDLLKAEFDVTVMPDGKWVQLSDNIRAICFSDYFQDAVLLIDVGGVLIVDLNDATDRGWGRRVKRIIRDYDRSYLLKLFGYGDVDMNNFFKEDGARIVPDGMRKRPIGPQIAFFANLFGVTDVIPFSCFHYYARSDSNWANAHTTPLSAFTDGFEGTSARLHEAFLRVNVESGEITALRPADISHKIHDPGDFGDDWSTPLQPEDRAAIDAYFSAIEPLSDKIDFVRLVVGGEETIIDLPGRGKAGRGVGFETPRNSLMTAIEYEIFDDLLIANFTKTTLYGDWEADSLHPHFTPHVAKFADNGRARSRAEIKAYFAAYRARAPMAHLLHVLERGSERRVRRFLNVNTPAFQLAKKTYLFLKRA